MAHTLVRTNGPADACSLVLRLVILLFQEVNTTTTPNLHIPQSQNLTRSPLMFRMLVLVMSLFVFLCESKVTPRLLTPKT